MGRRPAWPAAECVQACPTGALALPHALRASSRSIARSTRCPVFGGVGCQLTTTSRRTASSPSKVRGGPANEARLCVKGRYGLRLRHHRQRLTKPLIPARRGETPHLALDPDNWRETSARPPGTKRSTSRGGLAAFRDGAGPRSGRTRSRIRIGQGVERRGVSLSEARPHRLRHQQCRPLHAAVPCLAGRGHCSRASDREPCLNPVRDVARPSDFCDRRESHRKHPRSRRPG